MGQQGQITDTNTIDLLEEALHHDSIDDFKAENLEDSSGCSLHTENATLDSAALNHDKAEDIHATSGISQLEEPIALDGQIQDSDATSIIKAETNPAMLLADKVPQSNMDNTNSSICISTRENSTEKAETSLGESGTKVEDNKKAVGECSTSSRNDSTLQRRAAARRPPSGANRSPQLDMPESVTYEEARDGLKTALAYIQANNIFPGTTFKCLPRLPRHR
jgi:hypothetical protein